jgi:hypothetical protein
VCHWQRRCTINIFQTFLGGIYFTVTDEFFAGQANKLYKLFIPQMEGKNIERGQLS